MADLVAADLSYEIVGNAARKGRIENESGYRTFVLKITTAAGDYPTGGLPLDRAAMGVPQTIVSLSILEANASNTDLYKFDRSAEKIKVFQEGVAIYIEHPNTAFTSPDELIVEVVGY